MIEADFMARARQVEERIAAACRRAGRARHEVTLVAVSKTHPPATVELAFRHGLVHFGENYAQELRDKHRALAHLEGLVWHAIGPVQPKNAKYIAQAATFFHALESLEVARELSRRRTGPPLRCLVEVNLAGEATKAGLAPASLGAFLEQVRALAGLRVVGLTIMPPWPEDPEDNRLHFRAARALAAEVGLGELSMGTTGDFEVAIEEGATLVRVGTALFGERPATPPSA